MKPVNLLLVLSFSLALISCDQNKKTTKSETTNETKLPDKESAEEDVPVNTGNQVNDLSKLKPLTEDEMRSLLPKQIMGSERQDENVNEAMGTMTAGAEYRINDTTSLSLNIVDCAGPAGAGIYNLQYIGMLNFSEEDEEEYTRTIDFLGGKAFENCSKTRVKCTLTWFTNRFLVSLDGDLPADRLKQIAATLKF
jgi:hypothetical protein